MNGNAETLQTVFTKNRTEELGYDVWKNFVVPPFYDQLDLYRARKPRIIVGGRGCGKTMLLRYLSHQSTFSPERPAIPPDAVAHIGLYWRADTQFAKLMTGRNIDNDVWESAFDHLLALVVGIQILQSLRSIARSQADALREDDVFALRFDRLAAYDVGFDQNFQGFLKALERKLHEFELWVANVRKLQQPTFLPGTRFLLVLVSAVKDSLPPLKDAVYYVYLDEYENLHEYQQQIVNTYLKHSEMPLIFNIAMKRYGFSTTKTVGEESIINIADYRTHDLEKYLLEGDFPLFAAEVLFINLAIANVKTVPIEPRILRDVAALGTRREKAYRDQVLSQARQLFPGLSHDDLAKSVFEDPWLQKKLKERIIYALRKRSSGLPVERFFRPTVAQASITASALLYRRKPSHEEIAEELDRLEKGEDNRFTGTTDWMHNNFIGCLLSLYESHSRACPFYAGFETFCLMSRGNMRHFLELCHRPINQSIRAQTEDKLQVAPKEQALAARQTSAAFLGEIRSFGRLGNQLHTFILRLGSLFAMSHRSLTQSEPERCHFAIVRGRALTESDHRFLREATKWSVLFEVEETKVKEATQPANFEYVLNPIYAPYFGITYRKRRKLELRYEEFHVLKEGTYDGVSDLLKRYAKNWSVELSDTDPTLFSHLFDETE